MSDIPEGYKQTEVGVIPVDWEVKRIGDVAPLQRGFDLPNKELKKGNFPVVYSNGIVNYHNAYKVKAPGVVTGRSGTIGKVTFVEEDYWPHNTSLWVTNFKNNNPKFIYYLFLYIKLDRFGTGSGVPTLNRNDVHSFQIPLPTLPEQQSIASALSDVDALITTLEQLITKKRNIKQGAMQQLLTGKKRLPGFGGEWEELELTEFGTLRGGSGFPIKYQGQSEGEYPFYKVSDMNNKGNEVFMSTSNNYINENIRKLNAMITFPKDTIVFAKIGAAIFLERKKILSRDSCIDNNMMGFIMGHSKCNTYFFYSLFHSIKLGKLVSTTALPSLSGNEIGKLRLKFPSLTEQQAIATILRDMDSEIEALEQKRDKYRALKQGMMQELLTGKTRLV